MGKALKIGAAIGLLWGGVPTPAGLGLLFSAFSSPAKQKKPDDVGVMLAQEGDELIRVFGTARHGMKLVWSSGLIATKGDSGGGSGGLLTAGEEYTYKTSCFYVGGIGPIDRVKRIKLNNKVFYNRTNDGDETGFSLEESEDGFYFFGENKAGTKLRIYKGLPGQPVDSMLEAVKGAGQWTNYEGMWCVAIEDLECEDYNNGQPNATAYPYNSKRNLKLVIEEIGGYAGYEAADFDLEAVDGILISENEDEGYMLRSRRTAASSLKELELAHHFKLVPVDGVIRAVPDGGSPVVRIPYSAQRVRALSGNSGSFSGSFSNATDSASLGTPAHHDDAQAAPYIQEVAFFDPGRENNTGLRAYALPTDGQTGSDGNDSRRVETQSLNFSMGGGRAARLAKIIALRRRIESTSYTPTLGLKYRWLAPGDVVTLETSQGDPITGAREDVDVWLQTLRTGQPGVTSITAPKSDALLYSIPNPPDTAGLPIPVVPVDEAVFFYSDTNGVLDTYNSQLGIYVAWGRPFGGQNQKPVFSASGMRFSGGIDVFRNSSAIPESTIGNVVGTLPNFDNGNSYIWDDETELTVEFATGRDLQSRTDAELYAGKNALIIGREILQFGVAQFLGTFDGRKRWKLTHLLRGRRGTEHWMGLHTASELVCVIDHGLGFIAFDPSLLNQTVDCLVNFKNADDIELGLTLHGRTFFPYSPATIQSERNDDGDCSVTFENRSRYGYSFGISPADNPFGETPGDGQYKYEMDLLDAPGGDVLKTYYSNDLEFTIPAADQVTLFGGLQSEIDVVLYQNSGLVGRGYPAAATV